MRKGNTVEVLAVDDGCHAGIKVGMIAKVVSVTRDGCILIEHPEINGHNGDSKKKGHRWYLYPGSLEIVMAKKKKGQK